MKDLPSERSQAHTHPLEYGSTPLGEHRRTRFGILSMLCVLGSVPTCSALLNLGPWLARHLAPGAATALMAPLLLLLPCLSIIFGITGLTLGIRRKQISEAIVSACGLWGGAILLAFYWFMRGFPSQN